MDARRLLVLALLLVPAIGTLACGERRRERREERIDDRQDRRIERFTGWEKLGERMVQGARDRDTIVVTRAEGTFARMMVVVEHSALELFDLDVTFGDGSKFSPPMRLVFAEDTRSRVIDLPGGRRVIRKVEFKYGNLPGGGRAQIELWGQ
jgi:hypothetical protein